jgi:hypothetical protein
MLMVTLGLSTIAMRRRRSKPASAAMETVRDQVASNRRLQGARQEVEEIFVQISELARQLNAQMDTRFAKIEHAIAEADEKIASLEGLLRQAAGVKEVDVLVQDKAPDRVPAVEPPTPPNRKGGRKTPKADKTTKGTPAAEPPTADDLGELRYSTIYSLADQGLSSIDIARQTGQTTGEVELILNLRRSRAK